MADEVLVCNCGSSSVKIDLFSFENNNDYRLLAQLSADRIGTAETRIKLKAGDAGTQTEEPGEKDHRGAVEIMARFLEQAGLFKPENRTAVGHRVVHGGPYVNKPVIIDKENHAIIEKCSVFAPLHNPANLAGIDALKSLYDIPHVGVFDTAFHADMPGFASNYALPAEVVAEHEIRRYGFHGTSHEYVGRKAAGILQRDFNELKLITLHLGNGASACLIKNGRSVDTSMGMTPLEGLVMGTRSGDIDPAIFHLIADKENMTTAEVENMLNRASGLKGIAGINDMRDILKAAASGDNAARLAVDVFCYRARKYTGAYMAAANGVDAVVFTGGIGENSGAIRAGIISEMDYAGLELDEVKNDTVQSGAISKEGSKVTALVVPTDEEYFIAEQARALVK